MKKRRGFTLLETLLALMVFSMAVVALVEAVHQLGEHTLLRRHEAAVQERMRSLLVEHTRRPDVIEEVKLQEGDVSYTVTHTPLELKNRDDQPVTGLFEVRVTAAWMEGKTPQQASAETWVYPPLFR
ncbi:MAG: type II secretion system protein [Verrucomicrobia bacterium]|nr:type II secretion system protein [Verrucomicrobiota bacterium]